MKQTELKPFQPDLKPKTVDSSITDSGLHVEDEG